RAAEAVQAAPRHLVAQPWRAPHAAEARLPRAREGQVHAGNPGQPMPGAGAVPEEHLSQPAWVDPRPGLQALQLAESGGQTKLTGGVADRAGGAPRVGVAG